MNPPVLIALDWGTSNLRGFLLDAEAAVIAQAESPSGVQRIADGGWRSAFEALCADWLARHPGLPAIACGMVGSRQGWREAPYAGTPAGFDAIAARLLRIDELAGRPFAIVPGVSTIGANRIHDVMRGEETQVLGALAAGSDACRFVLPGTHSKWVATDGPAIVGFRTYMTGELYDVLARHSTIGRLMAPVDGGEQSPVEADADGLAFDDGVALARAEPQALSALLFGVRAEALFGRHPPKLLPAFLSGVLIGAELAHATAAGAQGGRVGLIGSPALVGRYARALAAFGIDARAVADNPTVLGLWTLATAAGLAPASDGTR